MPESPSAKDTDASPEGLQSVEIEARRSAWTLYGLQISSYAGNALFKPYVNLYLVNVGISVSTLGILLGIGALFEMLLPPVLNTIADRQRWHRKLYILLIIGLCASNIILILSTHLLALALAVILIESTFRPSMTLGMQLVISRMAQEGRQIVGRVRGFSSLGFGLASILANRLFILGGYSLLFISAAIAFLMSMFFARALPVATTDTQTPSEPQQTARVPRSRAFYIVLVSMFFIMMGQRVGLAFWLVHFQQHLGVSTDEITVIVAIMALVEIPTFLLLDPILKRLDLRMVFIAGGAGMALFWWLVGILPDRGWIYPLLLLRGVVFSVLHLTTFLVIGRVSHPVNVSTNQALAQGTIPALAMLLVAPISGWIYNALGPQVLFTLVACVSLLGLSVSLLASQAIAANR